MFKNKYRIVRDIYAGYECQKKRWWFPVWLQVGINTSASIEEAQRYAYDDNEVVWRSWDEKKHPALKLVSRR